MGKLIETNEADIRSDMSMIYVNKTKQIINTGRLTHQYMGPSDKDAFQKELMAAMQKQQ